MSTPRGTTNLLGLLLDVLTNPNLELRLSRPEPETIQVRAVNHSEDDQLHMMDIRLNVFMLRAMNLNPDMVLTSEIRVALLNAAHPPEETDAKD